MKVQCKMTVKKFQLFVLFCALLSLVSSQEIINKICTDNYDRDACQQISRSQEFACTEDTISKVDCFININQGEPQFAVVNAEQALLAAPLVSDKVIVLGEIKPEKAPFQTTIIVRKPFNGTFEGLRGKPFCHPGFRHDELVTKFVLKEFESKIINLNTSYCDTADNVTLLEKEIRALASFFGASCRPGTWTESDELDTQLKLKYSSLCDLCGTERCSINYQVPFNDTLQCLTQRRGDIALTTLNDASVFFTNSDNKNNFVYLCPNGSISDSSNPCTWTNQLNRLIVTGNDYISNVKSYIQNQLINHLPGSQTATVPNSALTVSLEKVLGLEKTDTIIFSDATVTLKSFVEARRTIPSNATAQCKLSVKWCTLNELEQQKCLWLQQAALGSGIQPLIECRQTEHNESLLCLNDIESGDADITFTDVNYGYSALKKGLSIVAYSETDTRQLSSILIVTNYNTTNINSLNDLKGKRACFPEYAGKEWLAFIDALRSKKVMATSCDYGKLFSDFVGDSCVPGAREKDYEIENSNPDKLCAQCIPVDNTLTHKYCNADIQNKYYGSDGALRCLIDNAGDYAVITRNDVIQFADDSSAFRVLSKNGSLSELKGINVDENAPLIIITAGGVVARNNSVKRDDIVLLLRDIEKEFGQSLLKIFKVFERFNNTKDLLFPDSTPGLTFGGTQIKYVDNFKNLLSNSEKCIINPTSGAINVSSTLLMVLLTYFIIRLL